MFFNSITFAVFFLAAFIAYWILAKRKLEWQNALLLVSSYFFYGWWDWRFLGAIVLSSLINYYSALSIDSPPGKLSRKAILVLSIIANVGILIYFKYTNFFIESFLQLSHMLGFQGSLSTLQVILPVGLSYFTLQSIAYNIDVYRKQIEPEKKWLPFFVFIAFFPQLISGPIERAKNLLVQMGTKRVFNYDQVVSGCRWFLWGLFKKAVIADRLAYTVDMVYDSPEYFGGLSVAFATLAFGFQIYCDFSGYSDMAIGVGKMLGFRIALNFDTPYFSTSFREFWRKWHMTLSSWMRDYLYISLGGSRVGYWRWLFNLMATFVISGFWHGANVTFILWGFFNGLFVAAETTAKRIKLRTDLIPVIVKWGIVFVLVNFSRVFFRAQNVEDALTLIHHTFIDWGSSSPQLILDLFTSKLYMIYTFLSLALFILIEWFVWKRGVDGIAEMPKSVRIISVHILILWILLFGEFSAAPQFIYFQF